MPYEEQATKLTNRTKERPNEKMEMKTTHMSKKYHYLINFYN